MDCMVWEDLKFKLLKESSSIDPEILETLHKSMFLDGHIESQHSLFEIKSNLLMIYSYDPEIVKIIYYVFDLILGS